MLRCAGKGICCGVKHDKSAAAIAGVEGCIQRGIEGTLQFQQRLRTVVERGYPGTICRQHLHELPAGLLGEENTLARKPLNLVGNICGGILKLYVQGQAELPVRI